MKSKGIETPRKDKGRRKAAHGIEIAVSILLPTGCCSPVANQTKEMLSHNFSISASDFFPLFLCSSSFPLLFSKISGALQGVSYSKQILLVLAVEV